MPIFTAIGTAIAGALFAGSTIAASLISAGLAFGARLAVSYLNRPKKRKYSAVQGEVQYGADIPVGAMFGTGMTKGHRAFYGKWGKGNKFNADVFLLANGWCDGLEALFFYGEQQTLVPVATIGGEAARFETTGFGNNLTIRFYDGRPGQTVDAKLVADTAGSGRTWKSTSRCAGICYVIVEREYDSRFAKGTPEFSFVLRGLRLYDPRKDSTIAGGSGAHRLDNPATWEYSGNPALQRLNYQIGLKGLISGRTLIGEGKSIGQLDLSSYFAAMNVCDTIKNGKPTYQSAMYVESEDDHTEILKEFDDAMAGYGLNRRGLSGVIPGAPQIPVLEITSADIPVDRAQDVSLRKSAFDMYNMMSGQFTSIESQWGAESLKPIIVNQDIEDDGRRRQTSNDFLQVSDPDIAQYLLNIRYRQNRKGGQATVPVSRRVGLKVQEGEWVSFQGKTWLVTEWRCDEQFRFTLVLSETGADIYSDGDIEPGPVIVPPSPPINPSILSTIQDFKVEVGLITGSAGFERPALRFDWLAPDDPTITEVRVFYRKAGTFEEFEDKSSQPEAALHGSTEPGRAGFITGKNVQSGAFYEARATITTVPDRFKTFTPWLTTLNETGFETIYNPGIVDEINQAIGDHLEWGGGTTRWLTEQIERINALVAATGSQSSQDKVELKAVVGNVSARFSREITVVANATEAAVIRVETLEATVNNPVTGVIATATAVDSLSTTVSTLNGVVTAQATAITNLTSSVGAVSANGLFRVETVATEAGALSTIGLSASTTSGSGTNTAALFLSSQSGGLSSVTIIADRLVISNPGETAQFPFIFQSGILTMNATRVNTITAGMLRSTDSKMQVDLSNRRILVADNT
ncbi:phage tail protein [Phyllobacterium chamaecytisi]|uniref:phage tail protein n=1 Tax=Phyllobacterium chamaecytisi TaxID=2876082 RepID=UPI001CCFC484|nr:phage tail protein [Phyllobacterium sp. KW56]MBZ9600762.1 phage tail protein [Phyllobacterium sp. KW56]